MAAVERNNPELWGVLPEDYARPDAGSKDVLGRIAVGAAT